jgi:hypothetical protein
MRNIAIAVLLACSGPAFALDGGDRAAVQSVIEQQLSAFLKDDGAAAYSLAAPQIQAIFPTSEIFMAMVRRAYQPVYRPRSHSFAGLKATEAGLEQSVDITDAAGDGWTAVYKLAKQPDGSWKITGCALIKKQGLSV